MSSTSRRAMFRAAARAAGQLGREAQEAKQVAEAALEAPPSAFSSQERQRYARQFELDGWGEAEQLGLRDTSALIIGAGALGATVAHVLVGAGVGSVGIVDPGFVSVAGVHSEPLYGQGEFGTPKAHAAVARLQLVNTEALIEPYQVAVGADTVDGLILGHDIVIDATGAHATHLLVARACCAAYIDYVTGAAAGLGGLAFAMQPRTSACYRCAFPTPPTLPGQGLLAPAAGVVAHLMALDAIKLLSGYDEPRVDAYTVVELGRPGLTAVPVSRDADCPDCGDGEN